MYKNNEVAYTEQQKQEIITKYVQITQAIQFTKSILTHKYNYLYDWAKYDIDEGSVATIDTETEMLEVCNNIEIITNVLVDYLYDTDRIRSKKTLLWQICGQTMFNNVMRNSGYKIEFPFRDPNGDLTYMGNKYTMKEVKLL